MGSYRLITLRTNAFGHYCRESEGIHSLTQAKRTGGASHRQEHIRTGYLVTRNTASVAVRTGSGPTRARPIGPGACRFQTHLKNTVSQFWNSRRFPMSASPRAERFQRRLNCGCARLFHHSRRLGRPGRHSDSAPSSSYGRRASAELLPHFATVTYRDLSDRFDPIVAATLMHKVRAG
jgi:hypothetical protein